MSPNTMDSKSEICLISIVVPVESDEEALKYKKAVKAVFSDKEDADITFSMRPDTRRRS